MDEVGHPALVDIECRERPQSGERLNQKPGR